MPAVDVRLVDVVKRYGDAIAVDHINLAGQLDEFPIWVWASIRNNLPPQVHVIGTMVFVGAVGLVALSTLWERRNERRDRMIAAQEAAKASRAAAAQA